MYYTGCLKKIVPFSKIQSVQLTPLSTQWVPKKNKKKGSIFFGHPVFKKQFVPHFKALFPIIKEAIHFRMYGEKLLLVL
jgi:hypothetical protein